MQYEIIAGSFTLPDGTVLAESATIDLDPDVAAAHATRLRRLPAKAAELPPPEAE